MNFDNSWEALLEPGKAEKYFDVHNNEPFQATASTYSEINAWWLAEFSRLIYKDDVSGPGKWLAEFCRLIYKDNASGPGTREVFLNQAGLTEAHFFTSATGGIPDTQCAIIKPTNAAGQMFAVLVFRGSSSLRNWLTNFEAVPVPWSKGGQVHDGFSQALASVWNEVDNALNDCNGPLFYTGHSLGAALATLAASLRPPKAVYTFGSPYVGNEKFIATLPDRSVFRVVNNRDIVTTLPPALPSLSHVHAGELHYIAHDGRMLLNPTEEEIENDRAQRDTMNPQSSNLLRHFTEPPEFLADHAPVNYVAHLERAF